MKKNSFIVRNLFRDMWGKSKAHSISLILNESRNMHKCIIEYNQGV